MTLKEQLKKITGDNAVIIDLEEKNQLKFSDEKMQFLDIYNNKFQYFLVNKSTEDLSEVSMIEFHCLSDDVSEIQIDEKWFKDVKNKIINIFDEVDGKILVRFDETFVRKNKLKKFILTSDEFENFKVVSLEATFFECKNLSKIVLPKESKNIKNISYMCQGSSVKEIENLESLNLEYAESAFAFSSIKKATLNIHNMKNMRSCFLSSYLQELELIGVPNDNSSYIYENAFYGVNNIATDNLLIKCDDAVGIFIENAQ